MSRNRVPLHLSEDQRDDLLELARSPRDPKLSKRARCLLSVAAGESYKVISAREKISEPTLKDWVKTFRETGVDGVFSATIPCPPRITPEVSRLIAAWNGQMCIV